MDASRKEIIFLNRAYNDLDIQFSLIEAFAEDGRFKVRVIGYPSDGDVGTPQGHEAVPYMRDKYGISFETVLDKAPAPLPLRFLYKISKFLNQLRQKQWAKTPVASWPFQAMHVGALTIMRRMLKGDLPWLDEIADSWNSLFVVCDEVLAQKGRSYMMDKTLRRMAGQGIPIYIVKTGHQIYWDPAPNKARSAEDINYQKTPAARYLVPCELDKMAAEAFFTDENIEIRGNLRMDKAWINKLHNEILVPPHFHKDKFLAKLPPGKPRVVFMLSKLGYGIEVGKLKETIRAVANIPGVACAIKPHTRGMKFDFMSRKEIGNIAIVDDVPSTVLIEWSDIVLFTGSSIAFHSLLLGKRVGFLQYSQYLKTIFDDGEACDKFDSLEQLVAFLERWRDHGLPPLDGEKKNRLQRWLAKQVHGGLEDGRIAAHYKDLILEDLGLKAGKKAA